MKDRAVVRLKRGEGRTLKGGGAWIYDNEIERVIGECENGDLVIVEDFDGYGLGTGFINRNSPIMVRMMSRKRGQEIDEDLLEQRVREAIEYRKKVVDIESCRLIFGEADFLPGIVVDKFADYAAADLVWLTHRQAPWKEAYTPKKNNEITIEAIRRYFNE